MSRRGGNTDPRRPGGRITDVAGDAQARHGAVIDTRDATLLDHIHVALCELGGDRAGEKLLAIQLDGRINKTQERSSILYLANEDAAAALCTEILALASRVSPEFYKRFNDRVHELAESGALGSGGPG